MESPSQTTDKSWDQAAYEAAYRHVAGYILEPVRDWSTIEDMERGRLVSDAELIFDRQPPHQCYWNNRFCIATMCQLSEERQRQTAWCIVNNGVNKYWEWVTHNGYLMYHVLDCLKLINLNDLNNQHLAEYRARQEQLGITWDSFVPGYSHAPRLLLSRIIKRFDLPTRYLDGARILSDAQQADRERFNKLYPHTKVL
ncbi:MAG: hypothetical protein Q7J45_02930 [bacterium]|nr:hypothetical protein [bacterium]